MIGADRGPIGWVMAGIGSRSYREVVSGTTIRRWSVAQPGGAFRADVMGCAREVETRTLSLRELKPCFGPCFGPCFTAFRSVFRPCFGRFRARVSAVFQGG